MENRLAPPGTLTSVCADVSPADGVDGLLDAFRQLMPGLAFSQVLTRGGWHRLGGVVDGDRRRVAASIVHWIEDEHGGDVDAVVAGYEDSGYFATRLAGRTHYFTASLGEGPEDYVQVEIEELQEQLERPLVAPNWYPDSVEEFLEPLGMPHSAPDPVGDPCYRFRRITPIAPLVAIEAGGGQQIRDLRRFFADWATSSAGEHERFCDHWVLALREYRDREGERQLSAKPVPVFSGEIPDLPHDERLRGAALANAIHGYDRQLGYPFAWFFMMLTRKSTNYRLAESVLADQMGAYDYLPVRDLRVLRDWEQRPYGV